MGEMPLASALLAALALSAASGLRVFLPMLAFGIAGRWEWLPVRDELTWLTSETALIVIGLAAVIEVVAYYLPLLDNLLDIVATPTAIAAGTTIVAAVLPEMQPALQWTTAAAVGGGAAGVVQAATVISRGLSTTGSAGLANPLLSTGETGGAVAVTGLALLFPVVAGLLVLVLLISLIITMIVALSRRLARR